MTAVPLLLLVKARQSRSRIPTVVRLHKPARLPLQPAGNKMGAMNNVLLGQTVTLYFNLKNNSGLGGLMLGDSIITSDVDCGSIIPIPGTRDTFGLPHAVVLYMANPANGYSNN